MLNKRILQLAVPSIISNITVPLLGLVDVAIVGHIGDAAYIGAIAVGSMLFNVIYWLFGFLRMGTSGMTSQALGRRDLAEVLRLLVRSLSIGVGIGVLFFVLQKWLIGCGLWAMSPEADVVELARRYCYVCIWGAPAVLGLYGFTGWFIGMQNTRFPMFISIMQNVVNILTSLTLVYGFGMRIEGVALGTVIAQYAGFIVAMGLLFRYYGRLRRHLVMKGTFVREAMGRFFNVNRDIFLRTLCLVAVNLYFTSAGARQGAVILSVNTVLMQLYLFFSYFMDGFAYAGEALGGRTYGAKNITAFHETLRRLWMWTFVVTVAYTLLYIVGGRWIVSLLTDEAQVLETSCEYLWWAWLIPAAGCVAFIWDGIFIGLTATRGMLVSSFLSTLTFFAVIHFSLLSPHSYLLENHFLWLAMIVYLAMRGVLQTIWYRLRIINGI